METNEGQINPTKSFHISCLIRSQATVVVLCFQMIRVFRFSRIALKTNQPLTKSKEQFFAREPV